MPSDQDIIRQTGGMVASALGTPWRVDTEYDTDWAVKLVGPHGAELLLSLNDPKVEIVGCYPDNNFRAEAHRIGVTRDRGSNVIAREIMKRLLPLYLPELKRIQGLLISSEASADRRRDLAVVLAELFSHAEPVRHGDGRSYVDFSLNGATGSIDVYSETSASFTIHASNPDALHMIAAAIGHLAP